MINSLHLRAMFGLLSWLQRKEVGQVEIIPAIPFAGLISNTRCDTHGWDSAVVVDVSGDVCGRFNVIGRRRTRIG